jgi:chromosome transmission fidelity protein 1
VPQERLTTFSCSHIIPDENLVALILNKGPNNIDFDFTFESRKNEKMVRESGVQRGIKTNA